MFTLIDDLSVLCARPCDMFRYVRLLERLAVVEEGKVMAVHELNPHILKDVHRLDVSPGKFIEDYNKVAGNIWVALNNF